MNMYKSARRFSVLKRILDDGVKISPKRVSGLNTIRSYSGLNEKEKKDQDVLSFKEMLEVRRRQASRSLLVEVENESRVIDLLNYLKELGRVQMVYHYVSPENSHYVLVEMRNDNHYLNVIDDAQPDNGIIGGFQSNFFWFRTAKKFTQQNKKKGFHNVVLNASVGAIQENSKLDDFDNVSNLGLRMVEMYKNSRIDDLGFRLRFLTCKQIEDALKGINSSLKVYPFGSSVNGFGNKGGDLDMVGIPRLSANKSSSKSTSELVSYGKKFDSERAREQNHILLMNDIVNSVLPGCFNVKAIRDAFVPILKYRQKQTCLDCDLSLYRRDSVIMSELLYFFASLDSRVRPLVFFLRYYAKKKFLTNEHPGSYITNFQLVLLVIFFLQQKITNKVSFLPPVQELQLKKDTLMSHEVFHNLRNVFEKNAKENRKSLEILLSEFFQFYSEFDFHVYGISLRSGQLERKSMNYFKSIFIENPLSPELNVSKNVSSGEIVKMQTCFGLAFSALNDSLRKNEIDALSYLKINELVEPDHRKDETGEAEDVREEKSHKKRRVLRKKVEDVGEEKSNKMRRVLQEVMDNANRSWKGPSALNLNLKESNSLDQENLDANMKKQSAFKLNFKELTGLDKEDADTSAKRSSALKLNFKELSELDKEDADTSPKRSSALKLNFKELTELDKEGADTSPKRSSALKLNFKELTELDKEDADTRPKKQSVLKLDLKTLMNES